MELVDMVKKYYKVIKILLKVINNFCFWKLILEVILFGIFRNNFVVFYGSV